MKLPLIRGNTNVTFDAYLPEQADGDLHRNNFALLDVVGDELSELRPLSGSLLPQQVPR